MQASRFACAAALAAALLLPTTPGRAAEQADLQDQLDQALKRYPQADTDKDGKLSPAEAKAFREKMRAGRAAGRAQPAKSGVDASLGGGESPIPEKGTFRVLILSGQSNMVGQGEASELPADLRKPHDRIRIWAGGKWQYLVPSRRFGPEVSLARELAKAHPKDTIGIIKVAVGGTGILAFVPDWKKELADRTGDGHKGPLYKAMIDCVRAARKVSTFQVDAFVWKQGGKDMKKGGAAKEYLSHFRSIVEGLRKDTATPDMPAFISTYASMEDIEKRLAAGPSVVPAGRPGMVDVLRAHNEASKKIPHCRTVIHGKLPLKGDGIHFNTEGQLQQGRILAKAILDYQRQKPDGK